MAGLILRRACAAVAGVVVALGAGAGGCDRPAAPSAARSDNPRPTLPTAKAAGPLHGDRFAEPTRVRLQIGHILADVDTGRTRRVAANDWLVGADGTRVLLSQEVSGDFGRIRFAGAMTGFGLPGQPTIRRIATPPTARLALSRDRNGVWVMEQSSASACTLREVAFSGAERHPARTVTCDAQPIWESSDGLWVRGVAHPEMVRLLDPATLAARGEPLPLELIDADRALQLDDLGLIAGLRTLGTGRVSSLRHPSSLVQFTPHGVSPDGRHLAVEFATPSTDPQTIDVWVLDLSTLAWLQAPTMPAYAELKFSGVAWSPDGRLLLIGRFPGAGEVLAAWRPGTQRFLLRPVSLPQSVYESGFRDPLAW